MHLLVICISLDKKICIKSFAHLRNGLFFKCENYNIHTYFCTLTIFVISKHFLLFYNSPFHLLACKRSDRNSVWKTFLKERFRRLGGSRPTYIHVEARECLFMPTINQTPSTVLNLFWHRVSLWPVTCKLLAFSVSASTKMGWQCMPPHLEKQKQKQPPQKPHGLRGSSCLHSKHVSDWPIISPARMEMLICILSSSPFKWFVYIPRVVQPSLCALEHFH